LEKRREKELVTTKSREIFTNIRKRIGEGGHKMKRREEQVNTVTKCISNTVLRLRKKQKVTFTVG